ncbi:MAG TPA: ATP-binding protein [Candidatus Dormibacteraeota bacterium]|nr:ATP-binding protein [Candidatus Dormibacteraeota bacterium]
MTSAVALVQKPEGPKAELGPLLENAPVGMALCKSNGQITAFNPAFDQLLGISSSDTQPFLAELVQSDDHSETERLISDLFKGKRDCFQIDCSPHRGNSRPMRWTGWRVQGEGGAQRMVAMVEDLPSIAAAEQRLRQAERLETVGRLAGGVAHDFNNLLTGVLLYCDLLVAGLEPSHRVRKYAEEIRKAGLQATGLVRQLLAIARPRNVQTRPVSLNEIVEGMHNLLTRLIGENIDMKFRLDPNLGLVKMDPVNAQQVLLNLVLNARDAMPAGGQISIETRNCKVQLLTESGQGAGGDPCLACALFAVEDNGIGMDEIAQAHLFEPFFTTKGRGTGIGLATVHDIVTTNGGLIHVESKPGRGSRFSVLLPLAPETTPACDLNSAHSTSNVQVLSSIKEESTL